MSDVPNVPGFSWSGVASGIKASGAPDLALLYAEGPATAAAVFTRNRVKAAPVQLAMTHAKSGLVQAIVVNSGNANACTGKPGMLAAKRMTGATAKALGIEAQWVLPASTGVIGQLLPADKIEAAMPSLVQGLSADGVERFAQAIMTSDRFPKLAHTTLRIGKQQATLVGVAKGAGMIHPNMATTLAFVVTDLAVQRAYMARALKGAVDQTFNRVSVDGDTSTNDTLALLASGALGNAPLNARSGERGRFEKALVDVLGCLAEQLVADGEGTEHVVQLEVIGLKSDKDALQVASTVATSPLVKTALFGKDPNWGRLLAAAGRAGVEFNPELAEIRIGDTVIVRRGMAVGSVAEAQAHQTMLQPRYAIRMKLGGGRGRATYLACDMGHGYIRINADYRS